MNSQTRTELLELCDGWCDDRLSDAEVRRLEALFRDNEDAQRVFVEATALNHALEHLGSTHPVAVLPKVKLDRSPVIPWRGVLEAAAALITFACLAWVFLTVPGPEPQIASLDSGTSARDEAPDFAVLTHTLGAVWPDGQQPLRAGAALGQGVLKLEEGFAYLQFYNGVKLVLQGPAEMDLLSLEEAHCFQGNFHVNVPPHAQGYLIHTPSGELIDHGTEFGLEVDETGASEVHVFSGEVFFRSDATDEVFRLRRGEASRITMAGEAQSVRADTERFHSDREIKQLHAVEMEVQFSSWNFSRTQWLEDQRLLAYYDFDALDYLSGIVPATSSDPYAAGLEGVVIGARSTVGRWPGKGGFAFLRHSDRIRVRIPGYHDNLTLATWIRIDRLEDRPHGLLLSDGFDHGSVHWQFHGGTGELQLITRRESEEIATYTSPPVISDRLVGQWQHLACVYDRLQGEVVHYLNGRELNRAPLVVDTRLRVGVGEIGNWGQSRDGIRPQHHLLGVMDEFIVFDRVLQPEELRELVEQGEPG